MRGIFNGVGELFGFDDHQSKKPSAEPYQNPDFQWEEPPRMSEAEWNRSCEEYAASAKQEKKKKWAIAGSLIAAFAVATAGFIGMAQEKEPTPSNDTSTSHTTPYKPHTPQ